MRLIDADKLKKSVLDLQDCYNGFSDTYDKACIIDVIDEQPTIKPRRGTWQRVTTDRYVSTASYVFKCDQCGEVFVGHWNFCPNCGADMRGETDE